jgi:hypothetical protein
MTASAPRRATFVIYMDKPEFSNSSPRVASKTLGPHRTIRVTIATAGDKENLHPLTGRRPNVDDLGKKWKATALATKLLIVSGKSAQELKKRKLAVAANGPSEEKKKAKKTRGSSRAVSTIQLPKLEEIEEYEGRDKEAEWEVEKVSQAAVNARCYELTVLPLADVSEAYEQAPPPKHLPDEQEASENKVTLVNLHGKNTR